ncbi:MAG: CDP-alcohol phosphatidyltransferase family protein [Gemmatimonadetes bacterium]|nr:CDP-alcohol phosphatidyltransferase family protein [Gemmatimonadota bacterium]
MESRIIGIGFVRSATRITLLGLGSAILGCAAAVRGEFELAIVFLAASGLCDLFDGWVARRAARTDDEQHFGVQIDTVTDMAAFGVAPAVLVLSVEPSWVAAAAAIIYVICAALRLAYFNMTVGTTPGDTTGYLGLPVTYAALVFPLAFIPIARLDGLAHSGTITVLTLGMALLFVLRVRVPKPRGRWYPFFAILAIAVSGYWIAQRWVI